MLRGPMACTLVFLLFASPCGASRASRTPPITFGNGIIQYVYNSTFAPTTVLEHTLEDASAYGVMTHWWSTGEVVNYGIILDYWVDGEAMPSVSFQLDMAAGQGYPKANGNFGGNGSFPPYGTFSAGSKMGKHGQVGGYYGYHKIPFTKSIRVTARTLTAGLQLAYINVRGHEVPKSSTASEGMTLPSGFTVPPDARLHLQRIDNVTFDRLELVPIATLPRGYAGAVALVALATSTMPAGNNYIEGCWHHFTAEPEYTQHGGLNCFDGHGARNLDADWTENVSLQLCEARCAKTSYCTGFALHPVKRWCQLRADINVDACQEGTDWDSYTRAETPGSQWPGIVVGTGLEDFFDSAYWFCALGGQEPCLFADATAGLLHFSRELPDGTSVMHLDRPFAENTYERLSAYRFFDDEVVGFRNGGRLQWRVGDVGGKCGGCPTGLWNGQPCQPTGEPLSPVAVRSYAWIYTWPLDATMGPAPSSPPVPCQDPAICGPAFPTPDSPRPPLRDVAPEVRARLHLAQAAGKDTARPQAV